jgi:XTP/dITP diphosphohydrolase
MFLKDFLIIKQFLNVNCITSEGICKGLITNKPIGNNGFAYDSIFYSLDLNKTFGEAVDKEKQSISHRRDGIQKLLQKIKGI